MEGCDELNKNIIKHNDMEAVEFINSLTNKEYNRIRHSHGDAECRRLLKEHLLKQSSITAVVQAKPEKFYCMEDYHFGKENACKEQCLSCDPRD